MLQEDQIFCALYFFRFPLGMMDLIFIEVFEVIWASTQTKSVVILIEVEKPVSHKYIQEFAMIHRWLLESQQSTDLVYACMML